MPEPTPLSIAVVALHTSPFAAPGSGDVGGMNVLVRAAAERMAAEGHRVEVVTRRYSPSLPATTVLPSGVRLRFLDAGPAEPRPKGEHEQFIDAFRDELHRIGEVDVVHSHHWLAGMAALPFARERGVPHVQSFHSIAAPENTALSAGERPESPGRLDGEAWLARVSDAIVAVSHAEEHTIVQRLGAAPERVRVVLPGVDSALFRPGERVLLPRPYVAAAARIEPLKGLDLAVRTIARVDAALRPDLVIAGGPTGGYEWHLHELRALADELGVADRVQFIGPLSRDSLADLFAGATAVLIPSHSETYGLVALEAAASGVPVIAAPSGGLREAVDPSTGILLTSRDPREWSNRLTEILSDDAARSRLAASARRFALERSWSRMAEETVTVYRSLLDRPDAALHRKRTA
jgi:Glycosyltransferase